MPELKVDIVERRKAFSGYFSLDVFQLRHELFNGGWSPVVEREVFLRGHSVAVLLYDPDADRVVLVEQFRSGALAAGIYPWLVEAVAGGVKPGESDEAVALRESQEEAGCTPSALIRIARYLPSPGGDSESITLFCGRVDSRNLGGVHGVAAEHEDIRVFSLPADDAIADLDRDIYRNGVTILALQWLALKRDALRREWGRPAER
jgi:ADP-ribose pyrophosphatase